MKNRLFWGLVTALVLLTGISAVASAADYATERPGFTDADSAFYLPDQLYFFYRPGLKIDIIDYDIPADRHPVITFTLTDEGGVLPLDINGVYTPIGVDMRYFVSYIPVGEEQRVNYVIDSRGRPSRDSDGTLTTVELGTYTYRYGVELPADYEVDATTTLIATGRRDMRAEPFNLSRYTSDGIVNFVPSGNSDPVPRDVVRLETCTARCHVQPVNHGRYEYIDTCEQCHNPGWVAADGEEWSLDAAVHREHINMGDEYPGDINDCSACHTGGIPTEDLPMIASPNPAEACDANGLSMTTLSWVDEGNVEIHLNTADGPLFSMAGGAGSQETGDWVTDGMTFVLVDSATKEVIETVPVNNTVDGCAGNAPGTYRGQAGDQWPSWTSSPSRRVCGSCHEDVDFEGGSNHPAQSDDTRCGNCHRPYTGNEWDRSVTGAHTVVYKSKQLPGVLVDIVSVTNTGPGRSPLVTFSIADKFGPIDPNSLNRLRFSLSGPNTDYAFYSDYENVPGKAKPSGTNWTYMFSARLPRDATGSYTLGVEGRKPATLDPGPCENAPCSYNNQMTDITFAFAVTDDEAVARRVVVDDYKCESCHSNLELHGGGRNNATDYCQTCHQPFATDEEERLPGDPNEESIHFKYMIHKIHRGSDLENGYEVAGHNNSLIEFGDVEFPGDLRNCRKCHADGEDRDGNPVDAFTYTLPLPAGVLPTYSPDTAINPWMMPITASCLSCHDSDDAAAHADANTSVNLGESCGACHSEGKTYSVTRVHAR